MLSPPHSSSFWESTTSAFPSSFNSAPSGHSVTQSPQPMHFSLFILYIYNITFNLRLFVFGIFFFLIGQVRQKKFSAIGPVATFRLSDSRQQPPANEWLHRA